MVWLSCLPIRRARTNANSLANTFKLKSSSGGGGGGGQNERKKIFTEVLAIPRL